MTMRISMLDTKPTYVYQPTTQGLSLYPFSPLFPLSPIHTCTRLLYDSRQCFRGCELGPPMQDARNAHHPMLEAQHAYELLIQGHQRNAVHT